jgi:hypothetical protein
MFWVGTRLVDSGKVCAALLYSSLERASELQRFVIDIAYIATPGGPYERDAKPDVLQTPVHPSHLKKAAHRFQ